MNPPWPTGGEGRPFVPQGKRALAGFAIAFVLAGQIVWAQNLGQRPQFNTAVQGQTLPSSG